MRNLLLFVDLMLGATSPATCASPSNDAVAEGAMHLLEQAYPADGPGAVVLVARGDDVVFRAARGRGDIDRATLLQPSDVFPIASLGKQLVAAATLRLAEQGRLGLDDPISKYLPDCPQGERIRIRHLLDHTAGIAEYTRLPAVSAAPMDVPTSTAALLVTFRDQPLDFAPGERRAYDNSGYVPPGAVIETVTGEPWADAVQTLVTRPLGLARHRPQRGSGQHGAPAEELRARWSPLRPGAGLPPEPGACLRRPGVDGGRPASLNARAARRTGPRAGPLPRDDHARGTGGHGRRPTRR